MTYQPQRLLWVNSSLSASYQASGCFRPKAAGEPIQKLRATSVFDFPFLPVGD